MKEKNNCQPNLFQKKCISCIEQVLSEYGIYFSPVTYMIKQDVPFLITSITVKDRIHEIIIYEDEAQVTFGKNDYYTCEWMDYDTPEKLIEDFCRRLRKAIETGKPY